MSITVAAGKVETVRGRSTPAHYRVVSIMAAVAIALGALFGSVAAMTLHSRTDALRTKTGPVLVATQELFSSLADANSAATAVYLSGVSEDREARRNYELAVERSARLVERVASLIGESDVAHAALAEVAAQITRYAGLIETARTRLQEGSLAESATALGNALDLMNSGIGGDIARLTVVTSARLDSGYHRPALQVILGILALLAAVIFLVGVQRSMARRTNRLINPPLALATLALLVLAAWFVLAETRQRGDLNAGRRAGYASIELTSRIQTTAYRAKASEAVVLTTDARGSGAFEAVQQASATLADAPLGGDAIAAARQGRPVNAAGLLIDVARNANGDRERAATAEMLIRWQRYREVSTAIQNAAAAGDKRGATALALQSGSSAFTGFNLSVESVLGDNRREFANELQSASDRLRLLRAGMLALPLLALLLTLWGVQMRINEYR